MKYQTTDGVLDTNKTKYPQGFDVVLKLNMSRTCFGVWDMTCTKFTDIMASWTETKIACLVSQSTMTKIMSNLEDNRSFLIKSIEIEFHSCLGIESCSRDL